MYAEQLLAEMQADVAPEVVVPEHTATHTELRGVQLDTAYENALYAQEWKGRLDNPGRIARLGQKMLNAFGVQSPKQQAMAHHETVIANYFAEIGQEGSAEPISAETHEAARAEAIRAGIADGNVTTKTYAEIIVDANPDSQAYKARAAERHQRMYEFIEHTSSERQQQRSDEIVAMERAAAMATGQQYSGMDELQTQTAMLKQDLAEIEAKQKLLRATM
jgi:hypothetical protein